MRKLIYWLIVAGASLFACVLGEGKTIVIYGHSVPITKLSPDRGTFLYYASGYEAAHLIYDMLVNPDNNMNLCPGLAVSWEFLGKEGDVYAWLFHLRQNVFFHNGDPFNAEVVAWNVERWMDPEWYPTDRGFRDPIAGVEIIDQYTVKIVTKIPFAELPRALMFGGHAVVDPALYEKYGPEWYAINPVGTGPYKVSAFRVGEELVLTANDEYWGGRPSVDMIIFKYLPDPEARVRALLAKEVDVIDKVPPHLAMYLEAYPGFRVEKVIGSRTISLFCNLTREPLSDRRVRQAISLIVPREAIAKQLFFGAAMPADSHLTPALAGYISVGSPKQDINSALALLAEAGWRDTDGDGMLDRDGAPLKLTLLVPDGVFSMDVRVGEVVAASLEAVGIKVEMLKVEVAAYWPELRRPPSAVKWDIALFGLLPAQGGSWHVVDALFHSKYQDLTQDMPPVDWNISRYMNAEVDALIDVARDTLDQVTFLNAMARIQEILWNDMPSIPLYYDVFITAAQSKIKGPLYWTNGFLVLNNISVKP
ncbi:MAG: ABC transporter substrate-binding protein [Candidatus Hadarchaeum sp.]|uniref:ABC transporter substrate-binding protein n=1 Tax=Candidatus Hadarchaeum sp. TaxID=2883567 RepID=UPI003170B8B1